jgi:hypothetical protein
LEAVNGDCEKKYLFLQEVKDVIALHRIEDANEAVLDKSILLTSVWYQYIDAYTKFGEGIEEKTKFFRKELVERVKGIVVPLQDIHMRMSDDAIRSPQSDGYAVLSGICDAETQLAVITKECAHIERLQDTMRIRVLANNHGIKETTALVASNKALWTIVQSIRALREEVMASLYLDAACDTALSRLGDASRECRESVVWGQSSNGGDSDNDGNGNGNGNAVVQWLAETIEEMNAIIPIVKMLQSRHLCQRHVTAIQVPPPLLLPLVLLPTHHMHTLTHMDMYMYICICICMCKCVY